MVHGNHMDRNWFLSGWRHLSECKNLYMDVSDLRSGNSFEPIHDRIRAWPVIIRGGVYTLLIFIIEYLAGWTLQNIIGVCPWDYGDSTFSIDGFIRLDYAPAWFAAGLIFERIHDLLNSIEIRRRRV